MEGVLVRQLGMPKDAFHVREELLVDVALQRLDLPSVAIHLLDEVAILSEELTDALHS
jgi:hypothetical protein